MTAAAREIKIILTAVILVLGGGFFGFLIGQQQLLVETPSSTNSAVVDQETGTEVSEIALSIMLDYGGGNVKVFNATSTPNTTLFDVMRDVTASNDIAFEYKEYSGLGRLIERIGPRANGEEGKYWQYWVNNNFAQVGADSYPVQDGDVILWKFEAQQSDSF